MTEVIKKNGIDCINIYIDSFKVELIDFGASIKDIAFKNSSSNYESILWNYENSDDYLKDSTYYKGATIGRVAGRIKKGVIKINDIIYQLDKNDSENTLHGGKNNFSFKKWNYNIKEISTKEIHVSFFYLSPQLENGFPGEVEMEVCYIIKKNFIKIIFSGVSTEDTVLNITNHTYFNLSGNLKEKINEHFLEIDSAYYWELDSDFCPSKKKKVDKTEFDYSNLKKIGLKIKNSNENDYNKEFNHPYLLKEKGKIAYCIPSLKNFMKITTSYPYVVIYANGYAKENDKYLGICFECQYLPDEINLIKKPKSLIKKGDKYNNFIQYEFDCSFKKTL